MVGVQSSLKSQSICRYTLFHFLSKKVEKIEIIFFRCYPGYSCARRVYGTEPVSCSSVKHWRSTCQTARVQLRFLAVFYYGKVLYSAIHEKFILSDQTPARCIARPPWCVCVCSPKGVKGSNWSFRCRSIAC